MSLIHKTSPWQTDDEYLLALDIGSEFVKAMIGKPTQSGDIEVKGIGRARQTINSMYNGAISDITAVLATCEQAVKIAEQEAGAKVRLVVAGVAGELIKGNTATVRYRRKASQKPITEQEIALIMRKVQEKAGELARAEVATETNNPKVEVRLINSAIVSLFIDGHKVGNPIGFKGSDLTIQFYTAFAPLVHISAIEKLCIEMRLDLLAVAVEPFAVCRACMDDTNDNDLTAIVMDIGGGTTDIAIMNEGGVEGTKMFGIGGRSFTRQIADGLGVDLDTAEQIKLNQTSLPAVRQTKLETIIAENVAVWLAGVQVAMEEFEAIETLPSEILLCGGGAGLLELQEILATSDWYTSLPFGRRPTINLLTAKELPGIINQSTTQIDHSLATPVGLLRVALDTIAGAPTGSLAKQLTRKIQNLFKH